MPNRITRHQLTRTGWCVFFSDVHIGAEEHAETEFDEAIRWAVEHEATVLLNGDIIENAIASSEKGAGEKLLGQSLHPTAQYVAAREKFRLLAKKGRIAGVTRGNHEARSRRAAMIDLSEILALDLGVPYLGIGGMVNLLTRNEKHIYTIALHHGRSGAKNIWAELDKLSGLYPEACLVAAGHNHALAARRISHIASNEESERLEERWQVRTGTYLKYSDYVREMVLSPGRIGSPVALFSSGKHHSVHVDCERLSWQGLP